MGELWAAESEKGGTLGLGDVWSCKALLSNTGSFSSTEHLVPFHKSSQWLVYSIIEPMEKLLGATIEGSDLLTALPDCWNGKSFYMYLCIYPYLLTYIFKRWFINGYWFPHSKTKRI
jgi:hypothetical protein